MADIVCNIPKPATRQELEQAIQDYRTSNYSGFELFCHWQAIRDAALEQNAPDLLGDRVDGEDSY